MAVTEKQKLIQEFIDWTSRVKKEFAPVPFDLIELFSQILGWLENN